MFQMDLETLLKFVELFCPFAKLFIGYISCNSVKRNNNNKKSITVNKQ